MLLSYLTICWSAVGGMKSWVQSITIIKAKFSKSQSILFIYIVDRFLSLVVSY